MLGFDSGFRFPRLWKRIWKNLVNINFLDCIDFLIMNSSEENRASKKLHRGLLCLRRGKKNRKKKRKNKKPGLVNTFHITFHTKRADCVCFSGSNRKDLFTGGPMMDVGWSACSLWLFDDCPAFSSVKTGAIMSRGLLPFFTEIVFWSPGKKIVLLTPPPTIYPLTLSSAFKQPKHAPIGWKNNSRLNTASLLASVFLAYTSRWSFI